MLRMVLLYMLVNVLTFNYSSSVAQDLSFRMDSTLHIERDLRLDSLVVRHARVNKANEGFEGYRVQVFSGSGTEARQAANDMRADFMRLYPDITAYLIYQVPNFKVRVGDFRTELEAIRLQRILAYQYPGGFVVRDLIKFPELSIEREKENSSWEIPPLDGTE